ncbi:hypothetical protein JOC78_001391 [Bacillus ectoiniformans]|uniref:S-layer homology domain-containing protein n=1 Tax=Bacillus ectoiniformans TaxID=1494429 RepID=UPI00195D9F82|nr:S-layer homology domain-containing protein [Bacillus ectoiniformans]MBM7648449.1 hypothetical protein [Bacillus ectoiniformans]
MKKFILFTLLFGFIFSSVQPVSAAYSESFRDLDEHWAHEEIDYLYQKSVIKGYSDGTFRPNNYVTRVQAMTMIARGLKLNLTNRPNPGFKDVPMNHYAYREIAAVVDEGIYPKSAYLYPNALISREVMARMVASAFQLEGESTVAFKDAPVGYWAYPYITKLAANNITTGYADQTFRPKNSLTRAQFSVFLTRALNDDFKTYAYTNAKFNVTMNLPYYIKDKLVIKEETSRNYDGVYQETLNFYYQDTRVANQLVWVANIMRVPAKYAYNEFGPSYRLIKKKSQYAYFMGSPGEHPYMYFENSERPVTPEAHEYIRFYDRLASTIPLLDYK